MERDGELPDFSRMRDQEISVNFPVDEVVIDIDAEDRDLHRSGVS